MSETKKFSLPHIFRKSLGPGIWVQGSIAEDSGGVNAHGYIHAPKQGDHAMTVLQQEINDATQKLGKPVTHRFMASNKGSRALVQRTAGYIKTGTDDDGNDIYEKTFYP